jgi:hypothetical protein
VATRAVAMMARLLSPGEGEAEPPVLLPFGLHVSENA